MNRGRIIGMAISAAVLMASGGACLAAPVLAVAGNCPGAMTFTVSGATPGGKVAYIYSQARGRVVIPTGMRCAGTVLDLGPAGLTFGASARANNLGVTVVMANVPLSACGNVFMQALDVPTCTTSNVVPI